MIVLPRIGSGTKARQRSADRKDQGQRVPVVAGSGLSRRCGKLRGAGRDTMRQLGQVVDREVAHSRSDVPESPIVDYEPAVVGEHDRL